MRIVPQLVHVDYLPGTANLTVTKNPDYWDADRVQLDTINYQVVGSSDNALTAFKNGSLDVVMISGNQVAAAEDDADLSSKLEVTGAGYMWYLTFSQTEKNAQGGMLANQNLRLAITNAIGREALVDNYVMDGSLATYTSVPPQFAANANTGEDFSADQIANKRAEMGLDDPILVQFGRYFVGLLLGITAALNKGRFLDHFRTVFSILGVCVPGYVFLIFLQYYLSYKVHVFPYFFDNTRFLYSSVLPAISLSLFTMSTVARFTRNEMVEVMDSDYVHPAESKGMYGGMLVRRHILRSALIPIVTVLAPLIVDLLTGALVIEKIYGINGIGKLILYGLLDPHIRVSASGEGDA